MPTLTCTRSPSTLFHRTQGYSTDSRLAEMLRPEDGHTCLRRLALDACEMLCSFKDCT